jgi:hypothetical protein
MGAEHREKHLKYITSPKRTAFSQLIQAGNRWSQRFLRNRHRLHAETLRNEDEEPPPAVGAAIGEIFRTGGESLAAIVGG